MFEGLFGLIAFAATAVAGIAMFQVARQFVRQRLRFVDAVRSPAAPWIAAVGVALLAMPVVGLLPIIGATTALVAGAAAGFGTASGVKALQRGE